MKRTLSEAFARYGMSVLVLHGGETAETKAFLQLVKKENGEEPFSVTALGAIDEHDDHAECLLPPARRGAYERR